MKVTNISNGPRGINGKDGPVLIEAGETSEVEVNDAELKVAKSTGWFDFGAKAAADAEKKDDK